VERIRVMLAEDEPETRAALAALLSAEDELIVVGAAEDADGAIELARRERPEVALLDVRMPGGGGVRAAQEIRAAFPEIRVLALSALDDKATVLDMLRSGAVGYLVKGSSSDEILEAVRRSVRGESILSPEITGGVIRELVGQLALRDQEDELRRRRVDLMRRVVQGEGVEMAFQPIKDLRTGETVGLEALARFGGKPPTSPEVWFQEAGEIGLRTDLELTTARAALAQLDRIRAPVYLSVNLSPDTAVSPMFLRLLAETPVDRVVFEISEHARVHDYDALNRSLAEIRTLGGRLAIDDAGAGFASLHHILRLSPDIIKLDISLTRGVDGDRARHALASALTSFAAEIGAIIVAEGIETREELEALRTLGVTHGQGYYLGRPGPLSVDRSVRPSRH
jgi:EAL domain-containing protein (putative c-di-GMP-specific phosphodiesterase class I)/CheY-like chemotaxis protein